MVRRSIILALVGLTALSVTPIYGGRMVVCVAEDHLALEWQHAKGAHDHQGDASAAHGDDQACVESAEDCRDYSMTAGDWHGGYRPTVGADYRPVAMDGLAILSRAPSLAVELGALQIKGEGAPTSPPPDLLRGVVLLI